MKAEILQVLAGVQILFGAQLLGSAASAIHEILGAIGIGMGLMLLELAWILVEMKRRPSPCPRQPRPQTRGHAEPPKSKRSKSRHFQINALIAARSAIDAATACIVSTGPVRGRSVAATRA